jgi:hypothetical protein
VLSSAITALEGTTARSPQLQQVLGDLRELRRQKEQSLDPGTGS